MVFKVTGPSAVSTATVWCAMSLCAISTLASHPVASRILSANQLRPSELRPDGDTESRPRIDATVASASTSKRLIEAVARRPTQPTLSLVPVPITGKLIASALVVGDTCHRMRLDAS